MFKRFKEIVQTRWKYLLIFYILGCAISLQKTGVPNIYYLIPIKAMPVALGWILANATCGRISVVSSLLYCTSGLILGAIVGVLVTIVCWVLGIDPMPFYGLLNKVN